MNDELRTPRRWGCLQVLLFMLLAAALTAIASYLVFRFVLFPPAFRPVQLNAREEKTLQAKLDRLDFSAPAAPPAAGRTATPAPGNLEPEPYRETDADRTVRFTEKELNALLARNTELADKVAIDLSQDLVSAKILIPLDEDVPVLGGKTLRVKTGMTFSFVNARPVIMFRGVSVMGVPLPNAWLGGLKDIDLARATGGNTGFWKAFADGVEDLRVEEGCVTLRLKK